MKIQDYGLISKSWINSEIENLETEMLDFPNVEIVKLGREVLLDKLAKSQEVLSQIGNVNLRSLEVYDTIKKEYDLVKEKTEIIAKEKEDVRLRLAVTANELKKSRETLEPGAFGRQRLRLLVIDHLQTMLDRAQENIGRFHVVARGRVDPAVFG